MGYNYYLLVKEINSLKKSTHYHVVSKKESEKLIPQEDLSITQMLLK